VRCVDDWCHALTCARELTALQSSVELLCSVLSSSDMPASIELQLTRLAVSSTLTTSFPDVRRRCVMRGPVSGSVAVTLSVRVVSALCRVCLQLTRLLQRLEDGTRAAARRVAWLLSQGALTADVAAACGVVVDPAATSVTAGASGGARAAEPTDLAAASDRASQDVRQLQAATAFRRWLVTFALNALYPGATYERVNVPLEMLVNLSNASSGDRRHVPRLVSATFCSQCGRVSELVAWSCAYAVQRWCVGSTGRAAVL
jgi:hypothetical protein